MTATLKITVTNIVKLMRMIALSGALAAGGALLLPDALPKASAASQRILVVVNDHPITNRDVSQRMRLNAALGEKRGSEKKHRKETLKTLIDEIIAKTEAKKLKLKLNPKHVQATISDMAKRTGSTRDRLAASLKKKGISMGTLRARVESTLTLQMVVGKKLKTKVQVTDAEVAERHSKITSDPRLKPVTVFNIREVLLPVEKQASQATFKQLLYARAIESQQIAAKYKGCKSLRAAAKGIFNVKIGKTVQAPVDKMPKQMRKVLQEAGTKRLIGPMQGPNGIRMIAYCGRQVLKPPKPPRDVVRRMILNEKYEKVTDRVMRTLRRKAFIEYKDASAVLTQ